MKTYSLEELTETYIGEKETKKRGAFETELRTDFLGLAIRKARQERNVRQECIQNLHYKVLILNCYPQTILQ